MILMQQEPELHPHPIERPEHEWRLVGEYREDDGRREEEEGPDRKSLPPVEPQGEEREDDRECDAERAFGG